jgi:hypothetical protein
MVMVEGGAIPFFFPCATYETKTVKSKLKSKKLSTKLEPVQMQYL